MKEITLGIRLFAVLFMISIFSYAAVSMCYSVPHIAEDLRGVDYSSSEGLSTAIAVVDEDISEYVFLRYDCIEIYGLINKILGKTEINGFDYALDAYGGYNQVDFCDEMDDMDYMAVAHRVFDLKHDADKHGSRFIYLQSPDKLNDNWNTGIPGIQYGDYNKRTDKFLAWFRRYGIDVIDFRDTLKESGLSYQEMFYNTDHHWTALAAFYAFKDLVSYMNEEYDQGLDLDGFYTDLNNYDISYCEDTYLGSAGRDIGYTYGGCNDFMQVMVPKFDGDITWGKYSGNYNDTVFRYENLSSENKYKTDTYGFYLSGVRKEDRIINNSNPDGLRILFVRDSYLSPLIIDMIPFCSRIDAYWGLYVDDDVLHDKVQNGNYDYVILSYGTINMSEENFNFYYPAVDED